MNCYAGWNELLCGVECVVIGGELCCDGGRILLLLREGCDAVGRVGKILI